MDLYEQNYLLLKPLLQQADTGKLQLAHKQGGLYWETLETTAWTTTAVITYRAGKPVAPRVDLVKVKVRVYHDAKQVSIFEPDELLRGQIRIRRQIGDLQMNWYLNRFLYNILRLCIYRNIKTNRLLRRMQ